MNLSASKFVRQLGVTHHEFLPRPVDDGGVVVEHLIDPRPVLRDGRVELALRLVGVLADQVGGDGASLNQRKVTIDQGRNDSPGADLKNVTGPSLYGSS